MKKIFLFLMCALIASVNLGCQSAKTRVAEGAAVGGLAGAALGGIIGHQSKHGLEGAGIGAVVGAAAGAVLGSQIEKPVQNSQTAAANPNQLSIEQIIEFTKQGASEEAIIDKVRSTNSRFNLDADDVNYLKQKGVSQRVIDVMRGGL